ncbi:hypothetical protein DACRYDRAFT_25576 [Dacryopinax primogenitus]|uniref:Uncharacterized protein n=1 Tax=Dacryopinax primogenitus (strain DJM 731) TaxID=1858805 RepID=M5FNY2_DACPD|nr:uncharacterized protein DACRYDRAFT_25576 [Dacryopinax primogenitus]EJT96638.1 hypothetical protein DACRYDRAFT_25576 [Dacryopinax primogenitus]
MSSTQWMYTYGLERGRKVERDTYTPGGGTREEINNVLIYRLTPPGQPAVPGVGVQKEDLAVAGGGVDMTSLSESQERDWVSKFFIWRVLMELKRIGRVRVSDPGCLWDEVCREVTEGLEERVRGSLEPRVIQCSYTF